MYFTPHRLQKMLSCVFEYIISRRFKQIWVGLSDLLFSTIEKTNKSSCITV